MKRYPVLLGALATSLLADPAPASADVADAAQAQEAATAVLRPVSRAAHDQILDLSRTRLAQGYRAFSEAQLPDPSHAPSQWHYKEHMKTPAQLDRKTKKIKSEIRDPSKQVASVFAAFQKAGDV
jgi:hypothetical protein